MSTTRSKGPNAGDVRAKMPSEVGNRSTAHGLVLFSVALALYLGAVVAGAAAPGWPLKLVFSLANAFFLAILFVIGHDACHSALTPSARLNAILGRIAFLPAWHPYAGWEHAHNHIHHAWTNLQHRDYAWAPLSKESYDRLPAWRRAMVRLYRTPLGLAAYYFFDVYLRRMIFPTRQFRGRMNMPRFVGDCLLVAAFIAAQTAFLIFAPRWFGSPSSVVESLFFGQWLPFLIWNWLIAFLIYLHHTHPRIPWFDDQQEWTFYKGQIQGTAHVQFPGPINWIIHNIMEHTAHHADPRIPLYHLAEAQESLNRAFSDDVVEHKFSWRSFRYVLSVCQLYDYRAHRWTNWAGEPTSSQTIQAAIEEPEMAS
ncbi:MAG TPA: fatty acid desaturase [Pirellulales bacterium]|nr:fatty acid desaturase [Pirellulales bacterium]